MCDIAESTIEELILAALASQNGQGPGATQQDLLRELAPQKVCLLHTLVALRNLLKRGHATADMTDGAADPVRDQGARWRLAPIPVPVSSRQPDQQLGNNYKYSPSDELGHGRFGVVYRARNDYLGRDVALKVLYREHTDNERFRLRFQRDARILARMDHPNIVKVHDGGEDSSGASYIAMEYIEGGTLAHFVKKNGSPAPSLLAEWMSQIADALRASHKLGILHRDVKLDNVMMGATGVKLTDFNLAFIQEAAIREAPSTFESIASADGKPPQLVGTIPFMATERINGQRGDHRSDIYSLCATFYSVATGGYIFDIPAGNDADAYMNWRWHHTKETPQPLTDRVPGFPPALAAIIHKGLEKDPANRYQTFEELLGDLAAVRGEGSPSFSVPPVARRSRPRRIALGALLLLVAAFAAVTFAGKFRHRSDPVDELATAEKEGAKDRTPENSLREHSEKNPDTHKTEESGKPELDPSKEEPKTQPISKPLAEQLAAYDPTADDLVLLRQLLALAGRERASFLARSNAAFRTGLDEIAAKAAPSTEGEKKFREWHLKAAHDLADLSEFAVSSRLAEFTTSGRAVSLALKDGRTIFGEVRGADAEAILVATDAGQERVPLANLAPSNFTGDADLWKASLAFQAFSGSAMEALVQVLAKVSDSEDLLLWIPLVVRLAHEEARAAAIRLDFVRAHELFDRLAAIQPETPRFFAHMEESDFKAIRAERDALKLLLDERFADVAARYPETLAYVPAAELILTRFCAQLLDEKDLLKKIATVDPAIEKALDDQRPKPKDIYEKGITPAKRTLFDFVGGYASVTWTPQPPDERGKHWDLEPQRRIDAVTHPAYVILRHPTEFQRLIYNGLATSASEGMVLVYRFVPGDLSARWRMGLESGSSNRVYLQAAHDALDLYQPALGEGAVDRQIAQGRFDAPPDTQTWRTLALVPALTEDGGVLLAFIDGNPRPVLRVSLKEAKIPAKPLLGIFHGELHVKNVLAPFTGEK